MKPVFGILVLIVLLVAGFFALNSHIYDEKQGEEIELRDGEHLGFIRALTDNQTSLDFDDAVWLTGAAAEDAAIKEGLCTEETRDECTPNDFFIKNEVVATERLAIDPNALVFMMTWRMEETGQVMPQEISLADFAALINDPTLHWSSLPYAVVVADSTVIQIEEVYIP